MDETTIVKTSPAEILRDRDACGRCGKAASEIPEDDQWLLIQVGICPACYTRKERQKYADSLGSPKKQRNLRQERREQYDALTAETRERLEAQQREANRSDR